MRRKWLVRGLSGIVVTVGVVVPLAAQGAASAGSPARSLGAAAAVSPRPAGDLDCNGLSPIQRPVKQGFMCADPRGSWGGRFYENGHYIGHDEPSVRFISNRAGSGTDTTFSETLPTDPVALPTVAHPGKDVTHWVELSVVLHRCLRPELGAIGAVHARLGQERSARPLSRRRRGFRRASVLPAGRGAVRRQRQLR